MVFVLCLVLISNTTTMYTRASETTNLIPLNDGLTRTVYGIKYSCRNGVYHISGMPTQSSYLNLAGGERSIPENLHEGDRLNVRFSSGTAYVTLGIRAFSKAYPDGIWLMKTSQDTEFVVPDLSGYTGVSIRITVTKSNRVYNMDVIPVVEKIVEETETSENLLPLNNGLTRAVYGIKYSCWNGVYHISGMPTQSSYLNLAGGERSIPENLHEGDRLNVRFSSGTAYVTLGIRAFSKAYPDGIWLMKTSQDTEFVVPDLSVYTGVSIRITVTKSNRVYNMDVIPVIEKIVEETETNENLLPLNHGLTKSVYGIKYSGENGTYHIVGTPTKSSYLNLCGGTKSIPENLREGDRLKIEFTSGTPYITLGIRAFNEEHPNGIWLAQTSKDTVFIVPDLSEYTGISIRITVTKSTSSFDLSVTPVIREVEKEESYLTIIDDDGDIHFLTDLLPLMQELQVPISTAVTTKRIGTSKRWMDWDDIMYLNEMGCEVLCHTYNHYTGTQIQSVDDETIYNNYVKARDELLSRGISGGNYLVYSSNTGNYQRVQNIAGQVFKCGIKIGGSTINTADSNLFALSRYRIDYASTEGRSDWNLDDMKAYAEEVAVTGGWQIWMIHTSNSIWRQRVCLDESGNVLYVNGSPIPMVDENGKPVLDSYGIYPTMGSTVLLQMLKEAILYAQAMDVKIVTVEEAYTKFFNS